MTTPAEQQSPETISDRFLRMITPRRIECTHGPERAHSRRCNPDRQRVEDQAYLEMLLRMIRALESRVADNPEIIIQIVMLGERLSEACNVGIAISADRYAVDPKLGASAGEIARLLGMSKQSVSERRAKGRAVMEARVAEAGAASFAEARRERDAIRKAHEHAEQAMPEYRARHLRVVA
jgi:hypothetical protein